MISMLLSVCLLAYLRNHTAKLHQFLCLLLRASRAGVTITDYVMYLRFLDGVMFSHSMHVFLSGKSITAETTASIATKYHSMRSASIYRSLVAHRGQSLLSEIALFFFWCCTAWWTDCSQVT